MKYVDFANEIDEHFAAIQKAINELTIASKVDVNFKNLDSLKEHLITKCIALNHQINDDCSTYLESE